MKFRQKKIADQVIVITGATSGIGLATARLAAAQGARLVLVARNADALKALARELRQGGAEVITAAADVADREAVEQVAEAALDRFGGFDTWVNNAGVTMYGKLLEVPLEDERRLFETNFWGVVNGSRTALEQFKSQGGTLINIGSVLSDRALPLQGSYSASKHAVKAFTDALRMELEKAGAPVVVNLIKPASIDTPLPQHARKHIETEAKLMPPYYAPEVVARAILHCAEHKHRDISPGGGGAMLAWLERLSPSLADRLLLRTGFRLQKAEGPPRCQDDALDHPPPHELETRGGYPGHVAKTSAYAWLRMNFPRLALTGAGIAAAAVAGLAAGSARGRRPAPRWSPWLLGVAAAAGGRELIRRRHRISFRGRTVVITGGSRGLGLVMARRFAKEGSHLVLIARDETALRRAGGELRAMGAQVLTVPCDITDESAAAAAIDRAIARFGRVDVLINNAGLIQVGPLSHMTCADFEEAMAVHFRGPLHLMWRVIPAMREAGGGRIVNISSIGGEVAAPHLAPYSASKFALTGLSESLGMELRRDNILVTTVCPGLMRTGSPPNARFKGRHRREYAWFTIADSMPLLSMGAGRAAGKIIEACRRGSPYLALGVHTKAMIAFNHLFPNLKSRLSAMAVRMMPAPDSEAGEDSFSGWQSESRLAPSLLTRSTYRAAARNNERPGQRR
jgi:short-subunit dehydrogenase